MTEPPNGLPDLRAVIEAWKAQPAHLRHRGAGYVPGSVRCADANRQEDPELPAFLRIPHQGPIAPFSSAITSSAVQ